MGVAPMSWECVKAQMAKWSDAFAAGTIRRALAFSLAPATESGERIGVA